MERNEPKCSIDFRKTVLRLKNEHKICVVISESEWDTAHTTLFNGVMKFVFIPAVCRSWTGHGFCVVLCSWHTRANIFRFRLYVYIEISVCVCVCACVECAIQCSGAHENVEIMAHRVCMGIISIEFSPPQRYCWTMCKRIHFIPSQNIETLLCRIYPCLAYEPCIVHVVAWIGNLLLWDIYDMSECVCVCGCVRAIWKAKSSEKSICCDSYGRVKLAQKQWRVAQLTHSSYTLPSIAFICIYIYISLCFACRSSICFSKYHMARNMKIAQGKMKPNHYTPIEQFDHEIFSGNCLNCCFICWMCMCSAWMAVWWW